MKKLLILTLPLLLFPILLLAAESAGTPALSPLAIIGRFHPVVLHFPVALFLVAPIFATIGLKKDLPCYRKLFPILFYIATLSTFPVILTGLILAANHTPSGLLTMHRTLGLMTAGTALVFSVIMLFADQKKLEKQISYSFLAAAGLLAALAGLTAHFGGIMVWGDPMGIF